MNIPKQIKIGGHTVDVDIVSLRDTEKDHGSFDSVYMVIRLTEGRPESRMAETLLHEIFEAIKHLNNLSLEHKDLTVLSEGLFSVIRNNNLRFDLGE